MFIKHMFRFEKNVFQYKGATICIFKMENGETVIVGADQEWRYWSQK